MAGIGNISKIEMEYMNAMVAFSRAYRESQKLIAIKPIHTTSGIMIYIPKSKIQIIVKDDDNSYTIITDFTQYHVDVEQGKKLLNNW